MTAVSPGPDLRGLFFGHMKDAMKQTDSKLVDSQTAFYETIDRIVLDRSTDVVFPRQSSRQADERIERLVTALEDSVVAFAETDENSGDETVIDPSMFTPVGSPRGANKNEVRKKFFYSSCAAPLTKAIKR